MPWLVLLCAEMPVPAPRIEKSDPVCPNLAGSPLVSAVANDADTGVTSVIGVCVLVLACPVAVR